MLSGVRSRRPPNPNHPPLFSLVPAQLMISPYPASASTLPSSSPTSPTSSLQYLQDVPINPGGIFFWAENVRRREGGAGGTVGGLELSGEDQIINAGMVWRYLADEEVTGEVKQARRMVWTMQ
ncbi:hypothetical protein PILCRDRAFT_810949 [Piloderma croceum F 1598]|uniref:Uncharacterized protein n=1 Tax=Piloderma croceum (strain F 1598) TaxID=765440 RepID=A0A0C3G618_PILCF|nr:hypothetical protein PILCRDRAFT_810949 [Piloderma croceum F 1598]